MGPTRHALPCTLTMSGYLSRVWCPGPDEALTGFARWAEIWRRIRMRWSGVTALRMLYAAWRHGVTLS